MVPFFSILFFTTLLVFDLLLEKMVETFSFIIFDCFYLSLSRDLFVVEIEKQDTDFCINVHYHS